MMTSVSLRPARSTSAISMTASKATEKSSLKKMLFSFKNVVRYMCPIVSHDKISNKQRLVGSQQSLDTSLPVKVSVLAGKNCHRSSTQLGNV